MQRILRGCCEEKSPRFFILYHFMLCDVKSKKKKKIQKKSTHGCRSRNLFAPSRSFALLRKIIDNVSLSLAQSRSSPCTLAENFSQKYSIPGEDRNWKASNLSSSRRCKFINVSSTFSQFASLVANRCGEIWNRRSAHSRRATPGKNKSERERKKRKESNGEPSNEFLSVIMDTSEECGVFNEDRPPTVESPSLMIVSHFLSFRVTHRNSVWSSNCFPLERRVDRWQKDCAHLFQLPFRAHPYSSSSPSSPLHASF